MPLESSGEKGGVRDPRLTYTRSETFQCSTSTQSESNLRRLSYYPTQISCYFRVGVWGSVGREKSCCVDRAFTVFFFGLGHDFS